jgi:hypothetical protein
MKCPSHPIPLLGCGFRVVVDLTGAGQTTQTPDEHADRLFNCFNCIATEAHTVGAWVSAKCAPFSFLEWRAVDVKSAARFCSGAVQ